MERVIESAKHASKFKSKTGASQLNQYTILTHLASGSYGTVKHCVADGQNFAVKIYNKSALIKKREVVRKPGTKMTVRTGLDDVKEEIRIQHKLNHPNILPIIEVLEDHKNIYVILEYCEYGAVLDYDYTDQEFRYSRGFSRLEMASYIRQLKEGLTYLRNVGIVHRDIKPQNILLASDGCVKISDFGKAFEGEPTTKMSPGTLSFSPPESFAGHSADIWALGMSIYTMVYKELPFCWDNLEEMLDLIQNFELSLPESCDSGVRRELQAMLATDPTERNLASV